MTLGFTASRHSTLRVFMMQNRKQIAAELAQAGRPNWDEITLLLQSYGLKDAKGQAVTKQSARLTWRYLEKGRAKAKRKPVVQTEAPSVMPEYKAERVAPVVTDEDAAARRIANANSQIRRMK